MTLRVLLLPSFHGESDLYLNLLYIAHFLEREGHKVTILDLNKFYDEKEERVRINEMLDQLREHVEQCDVIAMSSYKMYIHNDKLIYDKIREFSRDKPVLIGGWGPSCYPDVYVKYFKGSIVLRGVHGQAVRALINVLKIFNELSEIPLEYVKNLKSVCLEHNGEIVINALDDIIGSSELPILDWNIERFGLDFRDYIAEDGTIIIPVLGAVASCPKYYKNPCIYCSIGKQIRSYINEYGEKYFWKSVVPRLIYFDNDRILKDAENAIRQVSSIEDVSRIVLTLVDDCTIPTNLFKFIRGLVDKGLIDRIASIKFQTRPEYIRNILRFVREIDPRIEEKLVIDVGVEFFSNRDLAFARRGYSTDAANECLEMLYRSKARWTMYVILTTPVSTSEDFAINMENVLRWIDKTYLIRSNPYIFEEGTFVPEIIGSDNIKYVVIDSVEIPVRPRFVVSCEEIKRILELVDYYADILSETKVNIVRSLRDYLEKNSTLSESAMRLSLVLHNVEDLLSSLSMLKEALLEDLEVRCSCDESVPLLIDEEDNRY